MKYFLKLIGAFWRGLILYKRFIPAGFLGLFVVSQFISDIFTEGFAYAFAHLGKTLFSAELVINENVKLAIINSPQYGFGSLLEIIASVMIFYFLLKWLTKLFVKIAGAQAEWGAMLLSLFFIFALEISMVRVIDGQFGFIPIKDGLWFLIMNIKPVLLNVHLFGYGLS